MAKPRSQGVHLQGWASYTDVATVANWFMANEQEVNSMSHLVTIAFEALANGIVAANGQAIVEADKVQEVFDEIGRRRVMMTVIMPRAHTRDSRVSNLVPPVGTKAEAQMVAEALRIYRAQHNDHDDHDDHDREYESLGSEPDQGEVNTETLRAMRKELKNDSGESMQH